MRNIVYLVGVLAIFLMLSMIVSFVIAGGSIRVNDYYREFDGLCNIIKKLWR